VEIKLRFKFYGCAASVQYSFCVRPALRMRLTQLYTFLLPRLVDAREACTSR